MNMEHIPLCEISQSQDSTADPHLGAEGMGLGSLLSGYKVSVVLRERAPEAHCRAWHLLSTVPFCAPEN